MRGRWLDTVRRGVLVGLACLGAGCGGGGGPCWQEGALCFPVPPTGQSACYDNEGSIACPGEAGDPTCGSTPFCGQDAQQGRAPRTFTVQAVGDERVVMDSLTGLIWQQAFVGEKTVQEALDLCSDLVYAGEDDWRLPDYHEIAGIADYGRHSPAIDTAAFPGTPGDWFWSSSPYHYQAIDWSVEGVFDVDFVDGSVEFGDEVDSLEHVRCVRGEQIVVQGSDRFVVSGSANDEVVRDRATGLRWQKEEVPLKTWEQALVTCEGLSLGGHDDWRLPDINELRSLVNPKTVVPASDFPGMSSDWFWSSSSSVALASEAWGIAFGVGNVTTLDKTIDCQEGCAYPVSVRCVRGVP